jgi:SagB-type dehydrogenase family enzyme
MKKLINAIKGLSAQEAGIFLTEIFSSSKENADKFFQTLKYLKENNNDELIVFFKNYLKPIWLDDQIKKAILISQEQFIENAEQYHKVLLTVPETLQEMLKNTEIAKKQTLEFREMMKAGWKTAIHTDQMAGVPIPPIQKNVDPNQKVISLPEVDDSIIVNKDIFYCIKNRISRRKYSESNISLKALSYLLWATQGVTEVMFEGKMTKRTVPSGGSRHSFETYLVVNYVEDLKEGVYRYQPLDHKLVYLFDTENRQEKVKQAALGQDFVGHSAVTFIWSVIPYKCEWRYMLESKKIMLQDSGHLCQNLYLACESLGLGTCAIGAYDQVLFDKFLNLDSVDEFTLYVAPVGKPI